MGLKAKFLLANSEFWRCEKKVWDTKLTLCLIYRPTQLCILFVHSHPCCDYVLFEHLEVYLEFPYIKHWVALETVTPPFKPRSMACWDTFSHHGGQGSWLVLTVSIFNDCLVSYISELQPSCLFYPGTAATEQKLGNCMLQNQMLRANTFTLLNQVAPNVLAN